MRYDVKTEVEKDYLIVTVSGKRTFEDSIELISFVVELCEQKEIGKAVVDIRGLVDQPVISVEYKLAKSAAEKAINRIKKVALVCRQDDFIYFSFFETVARNRGLYLYAFQNKNEAIEWISEE